MTHNVTVDRVSEELATDYSHAAGDGQRHGPLVEQLEGEVVNGDLTNGNNTVNVINIISKISSYPSDS